MATEEKEVSVPGRNDKAFNAVDQSSGEWNSGAGIVTKAVTINGIRAEGRCI